MIIDPYMQYVLEEAELAFLEEARYKDKIIDPLVRDLLLMNQVLKNQTQHIDSLTAEIRDLNGYLLDNGVCLS